jgi:hypothetical protein
MRQVGSRRERILAVNASGVSLAEGARFNEAISRLSQTTFVPKGIYRFPFARCCQPARRGLPGAGRGTPRRHALEKWMSSAARRLLRT